MSTEKFLLGSSTALLTTELDSLANNVLAIGSAYDNTVGATGDGYVLCDVELNTGTWGGTVATGSVVVVWFLQTQDGTNYEDGGTSVTPARIPDVIFPLRTVSTAQRIIKRALIPWGVFKPLLKNEATGQTMNATGNTLTIRPVTRQLT